MKVLVLDDAPDVLRAMRVMIEALGHEPVCCLTAAEAYRNVSQTPHAFQAAVLDWQLGRGSTTGSEVAAHLPLRTACMMVSGYSREEIRGPDPFQRIIRYEQKPLSVDTMREFLEQVERTLEDTKP